jgi:hypothetical protein
MVHAQETHGGVVAGIVTNTADEALVDWAAFYCEYFRLVPPVASGATHWLPGNNTVYPRDVLLAHWDLVSAGRWEDFLHRGVYSAASLAILPPLLLARTVRGVWRGPAHRARLVKALPLISLFVCASGVGEAVGASLGPGDALGRVC